jgi:uncharacterized SAM-binding protein YcdF (DUF218 family)
MPYFEFDMDVEHTSVPLSPLLTGIYRVNLMCLMVAILACLLVLLGFVSVLAERAHAALALAGKGHAALLEVSAGQAKVLEALLEQRGHPRAACCPEPT